MNLEEYFEQGFAKQLAEKYEEVLRVDDKGMRARFGARHNHCPSSPVYLPHHP